MFPTHLKFFGILKQQPERKQEKKSTLEQSPQLLRPKERFHVTVAKKHILTTNFAQYFLPLFQYDDTRLLLFFEFSDFDSYLNSEANISLMPPTES